MMMMMMMVMVLVMMITTILPSSDPSVLGDTTASVLIIGFDIYEREGIDKKQDHQRWRYITVTIGS